MQSIQRQEPVPPIEPPATTSRPRTVTGNRFPRKCACSRGFQIPRDPEVRYVVDFGGPRPYLAYLREHSPDYGTYRGKPRAREDARSLPGFTPASELPRPTSPTRPPAAPRPTIEVAHEHAEATASPEDGRAWASGQLVFNAGQFESARSVFADYAGGDRSTKELRARVNRAILEDLEQNEIALRALRVKFRDIDAGESFGDIVARGRAWAGVPGLRSGRIRVRVLRPVSGSRGGYIGYCGRVPPVSCGPGDGRPRAPPACWPNVASGSPGRWRISEPT